VSVPDERHHTTGREPDGGTWADFRERMPVARRWAYFDHAAVAPLSGPAQAEIVRWSEDAACNGDTGARAWYGRIEEVRGLAAGMIGARPEEIALVGNTTAGINLVAEGYPWQAGDNVVTRADEFPSNQYPWMNLAARGVETRRVPVDGTDRDLERLAAACDRRTRIVTLSWVTYSTGWRHDLQQIARIAHDCGALLFLDAIQGLGVFPLDVGRTPVDFLAADGHKWLLGPEGAGVFFTRREHLELLRPLGVGWNSVVHEHDFSRIELRLKETAVRYEGGSPNTAGILGLGASLELLCGPGLEAIARRVVGLTDEACRRLEEIGAVIASDRREACKSGIVAFELPGRDPAELRRRCLEKQVVLSCRAGRLRISPHAYNDDDDLDRLIAALR
jgi:cysteine desulfurase/selenocysteine lyase